jgi:preprotein translocase subunit SecD
VVLDGTNLTITVPGDEGEQARSLGQTAQLRFREVVGGPVAATPGVPGVPGAVPTGDPAAPVDPDAPGGAPADVPDASVSPSVPDAPADAPLPPQGAAVSGPVSGAVSGAGSGVVRADVAPVSLVQPLSGAAVAGAPPSAAPAPPAPPPAGSPVATPADPEVAAAIDRARQTRQSADPAVQALALQSLDCAAADPLRGYDDPALPLVSCNQDGTEKYVLGPSFLEGTQIATAQASQNTQGAGWVIDVTFESEGAAVWGDYTSRNVGKNVAFVLDGEVVSAPTINGPIFGPTQITGQFNQASAQSLAGVLRYGSLPLSFESSEAQTVSATLGLASLQAGLIAGGVGLALVFVYCLFYYRALGVLTILSLVLSGLVVYAVLVLLGRWVGFTLDLAGVAGFIVAIGITADSFVIFFERLKDEVREGRSFRSAVPRAWVRARRTILSADAVSFLAAAVLYVLAVGQVKGFAFTLGMSTVLDLLVVFLVTHPCVALAANNRVFSSPAMSGLGSVARLGAARRATAVKGA